jgi:acyl transferase domain-containing protein
MTESIEESPKPLAIVGLSFRLPQDAVSPKSFWEMIMARRCAMTEFPPDRLNIDAHYRSDVNRLDSLSICGGHFLKDDLAHFDASFFSITAAEAEAMEPPQRLLLEAAFHALENAGIPLESIAKSKTAVFAGSSGHDWVALQAKDPLDQHKYNITGSTSNMLANRVSWFFDLTGPSMTIDTACSSSLLAVDLTCQSIWSGQSTMGLAMGSNLLLAVEPTLMMNNLGLLSKNDRCYSFDDRANGYSRGEGVGVLVIKTLEDAVRDRDTIRAVIRASASNQDGRTPGITQPSSDMQATLIQDTYSQAGLDMGMTRYFEAHGTGTAVGDPIETKAIGSVFRLHRSPTEPLYVGSVKSNIGHLEGASGIAAMMKVILALEKGVIPPNSENLQNLNPRIDDKFWNLNFPQEAVPWPTDGLRRSSISSFGYGGSNTHVVLDDAYNFLQLNQLNGNHNTIPQRPSSCNGTSAQNSTIHSNTRATNGAAKLDAPKLLVWSAADEAGITRLQDIWGSFFLTEIIANKTAFLHNIAHTLGSRRTHLPWRSFAIARPSDDFATLAERFSTACQSQESPNLAMIFSGQGAQWYAMGRELLYLYPTFLQSVEEAGKYLHTLGCNWNPVDELLKSESESNVNRTEYSQILCTILQIALVDLLKSFHVVPTAVLGHSSGEVAAAYCSGAISTHSAWKISYHRGNMSSRLEKSTAMKGSMLAVALSEEAVMPFIQAVSVEFEVTRLTVGCINSPQSVTVSGEGTQLDALKTRLDDKKIFCRRLKVNLAYHSSQMNEIAAEYLTALGDLEGSSTAYHTRPQMVSSITGDWVQPDALCQASHWVRNMISPVRFSDGIATLCSASLVAPRSLDGSHRRKPRINHILEIGPHSVLQGACKNILTEMKQGSSIKYLSLLVRNMSAAETAFSVFGDLHAAGYPINLPLLNKNDHTCKTLPDLPEYPFNHDKSYWHESRISKNHRLRRVARNDFLGLPDPNQNPLEGRWRNIIRTSEIPWVQDHKVSRLHTTYVLETH